MKKIIFAIFLFAVSTSIFAQEGAIGFFAGAGYYNGELNQRSVLYMPSPAFGVMYRHNFDERWTLRINGNYTTLRGDDAKSSNTYQTARGYSFSNKTWDIGAQIELNFKNFETDDLFHNYFTPYLTSGLLLAIVPDSKRPFEVAVPIGFGFKYALTNTITAGLEWNYRWTNSDEIDGLQRDNLVNSVKQRSYNPDTDWYSLIGVVVTVRVFKEDFPCPAF